MKPDREIDDRNPVNFEQIVFLSDYCIPFTCVLEFCFSFHIRVPLYHSLFILHENIDFIWRKKERKQMFQISFLITSTEINIGVGCKNQLNGFTNHGSLSFAWVSYTWPGWDGAMVWSDKPCSFVDIMQPSCQVGMPSQEVRESGVG